jgi:hypothetical protein
LILDSAFVQPFYKTLGGNVIAQLIDATVVIVPIILLTIASRAKPSSIFLRQGNLRLGFVVGLIVIMSFYVLTAIIAVLLGGMSLLIGRLRSIPITPLAALPSAAADESATTRL